ncbi:MAG: RNA polymerase factor sigma-54 [Deltaproteobacteria bacterium]|nr:RNA polymerase factor sigma-54 [Deltaproteobacteria bacterium]MBW2016386.1 RNA polymerase factor sigma-54 [Deltaproteobacteria bacterium]MBW2304927.1 RNA polymerase factor sigma-54 [Deltaproteobacteria bacterium]
MALQLKQSLSLTQQLIMTPQLQQAIKLLQLSRLELLQTIYTEMETNPLLEEQPVEESETEKVFEEEAPTETPTPEDSIRDSGGEDVDWESYLSEYNTHWAETPYEEREVPPFENITSEKTNLYSHLTWQLNMGDFDEAQREIGTHIIGNLDPDGYLKVSVEELSGMTGHPVERVLETLEKIQMFDPVGVAARDTRECLLIQARFQNLEGTIVEKILLDHMDKLENKKYDLLARNLGISLEEVLKAVEVIRNLEPKPGRRYSDDETIYISPDIYVFKVGDKYEIVLNEDGLPKLKINSFYREILSRKESLEDGTRQYIQEKLKSAAWLIKSIHQRQRTIYRVTESIVRFQREFFDRGITALKPLVLRDVAEDIQMHESTISRVTTNKYVHTPQGVFELKFFFNSAINCVDGDSVSSESVKEYIRNIIKSEDKANPLSDQEVADMLKKHNINVARRTVAKYRESLGILPSRKRKQPY